MLEGAIAVRPSAKITLPRPNVYFVVIQTKAKLTSCQFVDHTLQLAHFFAMQKEADLESYKQHRRKLWDELTALIDLLNESWIGYSQMPYVDLINHAYNCADNEAEELEQIKCKKQ